jgi:hypothetical protein
MTMTPTSLIPAHVVLELADTLKRLRQARADGDPNHDPRVCINCYICTTEKWLNRLIDKHIPREKA